MPPPARAAPAKNEVLANVIAKTVSVFTILGVSVAVFAYRRSLTPLYGSAPVDLHFSKIAWAACIIGSFVPGVSVSHAALLAGVLLCLVPNSTYWVAVYTGRMGNDVWGPVITHALVIMPIIALAVAAVKGLQKTPEQENAAPQQLITLPIAQTSIMTLQDLWPAIPHLMDIPETQILLQTGTLVLVIWAISPLFLSSTPAVSAPASTPQSAPQPPAPPKSKTQYKNKSSTARTPVSDPTKSPTPAPLPVETPKRPKSTSRNFYRLILLPIIPFLTSTVLQSPTLSKPLAQPYLHPAYPLRILSSVRSPFSGVVLVGEVLPPSEDKPALGMVDSIRYLRAGHSLLGGALIGEAVSQGRDGTGPAGIDEAGEPIGDSVYHAFMLQEAAMLIERPGGQPRQRAAVIGLGTGVAAGSLMRSNISTTIVEIDSAVYDAAKRFFGLPEPEHGNVVIKDARRWVRDRVLERENPGELNESNQVVGEHGQDLYDIVLHDVFTGGSLPAHVFTQQFWNDTKQLMRHDGVIAVNYAGHLNSDSARAIILTLQSVFPNCRAFGDGLDPNEKARDEFGNWVLFCTPLASPLKFRAPRPQDSFGSVQRWLIFNTLERREIDLRFVVESIPAAKTEQYILTDTHNPLVRWQSNEALIHWKIMREVLPDVVWETY